MSIAVITEGCSSDPLQASHDFAEIRKHGTGKSSVLAQHFIVSFKPGEITPERALQLGQEVCEQFLKGELSSDICRLQTIFPLLLL